MEAGAQPTAVQLIEKIGGRDRDRTGDPLLAKHGTGKTLTALPGVAYTNCQRNFRSSIVPKLYRVGLVPKQGRRVLERQTG